MAVGIKAGPIFGRININRSKAFALACLPLLAIVLAGCPGTQSGSNLHLQITEQFDDRANDNVMWHTGTITAAGTVDTGKIANMDTGVDYYADLIGPDDWKASTQQQMASWIGDCNGVQCDPCTSEFGGEWELGSVIFVLNGHDGGNYDFDVWLGSGEPPHSGGCDPQINSPVSWGNHVPLKLTGVGTATPSGTADGYTVTVTQ